MPPRITAAVALQWPRRRHLLETIQANPGIAFRELSRLLGLARGAVRYHLNVLQRANVIVERRHGNTIRLFEAHHDGNWVEAVLLREPALAFLHDWLKLNPRASQFRILDAMSARGWARSTTQHRLGRLVKAGLASRFRSPRFLLYTATLNATATRIAMQTPAELPPLAYPGLVPLHAHERQRVEADARGDVPPNGLGPLYPARRPAAQSLSTVNCGEAGAGPQFLSNQLIRR